MSERKELEAALLDAIGREQRRLGASTMPGHASSASARRPHEGHKSKRRSFDTETRRLCAILQRLKFRAA
jgi:hypothetical protein